MGDITSVYDFFYVIIFLVSIFYLKYGLMSGGEGETLCDLFGFGFHF